MDQDIHFQHSMTGSTGAAVTEYFRVPYRCTLRDVKAVAQADIGDSETLTLTEKVAGTALGVAAFGDDIAAGALATWTADADNGDHVLEKGEFIKIVLTQCTAAGKVDIDIELDPYAR